MIEEHESKIRNVRCTVVVPCFSPDAGFFARLEKLKRNTEAVCDWLVVDDGNPSQYSDLWLKAERIGVKIISLPEKCGNLRSRN